MGTVDDYAFETKPMYRQGTDVQVATMFHFDDEPLAVYYDVSGERPKMVAIEYENDVVITTTDHDIVAAVADDDGEYISKAAMLTPRATDDEHAAIHGELHPEMLE